MGMILPDHLQRLQFYASAAFPCSYLADRQAQSLIATPQHLVDTTVYSELIRHGFRRSGEFVYRPYCTDCQACVPVRLQASEFQANRSQRRAQKQHRGLTIQVMTIQFSQEHYALYQSYQRHRHAGSGMDHEDEGQYRDFLLQSNVDTILIEFRDAGQLRMVSLVDCVQDGLSAVYTFYDCNDSRAAFGTYNVLWLTEWCRQLQLPYLYLGYWIEHSRKMAYKKNFSPLQGFQHGEWQLLEK